MQCWTRVALTDHLGFKFVFSTYTRQLTITTQNQQPTKHFLNERINKITLCAVKTFLVTVTSAFWDYTGTVPSLYATSSAETAFNTR